MEKHNAIIFGIKNRLCYYADWYDGEVESKKKVAERIIIFEGEIDNPPLQEKEYVYIKNLNKSVQITNVSRNVEGGYVYYTEHEVDLIEDEITEKSKEEAEIESIKIKREREERKKKEEIENRKNRKWYQKLFNK